MLLRKICYDTYMSGALILILLVIASSIPAIAVYLWFRIARYEFSTVRFLLALLAGAAAFLPALILQNFFPVDFSAGNKWNMLGGIFVRIALTEELSHLLILMLFFSISRRIATGQNGDNGQVSHNAGNSANYSEITFGSATGLIAGLGFAILESAAYGTAGIDIILLRVFTTVLHGACGARTGAAAVMLRAHPVQAFFRFFSAVVIHGIYNLMIVIPGLNYLAAVIIALSAFASSILAIRGGMSPKPLD